MSSFSSDNEDYNHIITYCAIIIARKTCHNSQNMIINVNDSIYGVAMQVMRIGNWLEGSRIALVKVVRFIICWCDSIISKKMQKKNLICEFNKGAQWWGDRCYAVLPWKYVSIVCLLHSVYYTYVVCNLPEHHTSYFQCPF